jgi:hypothetical protein
MAISKSTTKDAARSPVQHTHAPDAAPRAPEPTAAQRSENTESRSDDDFDWAFERERDIRHRRCPISDEEPAPRKRRRRKRRAARSER